MFCPMILLSMIAPLFAILAAILLNGKGYPQAGKLAGLGALGTLAWSPVVVVTILVADNLGGAPVAAVGGLVALALCIGGNTLLARASGLPELGPARLDPQQLYLVGLAATVVLLGSITGLAIAFAEYEPFDNETLMILGIFGFMIAWTLGPLWIGGAGVGMATVRAFQVPRLYDDRE